MADYHLWNFMIVQHEVLIEYNSTFGNNRLDILLMANRMESSSKDVKNTTYFCLILTQKFEQYDFNATLVMDFALFFIIKIIIIKSKQLLVDKFI